MPRQLPIFANQAALKQKLKQNNLCNKQNDLNNIQNNLSIYIYIYMYYSPIPRIFYLLFLGRKREIIAYLKKHESE